MPPLLGRPRCFVHPPPRGVGSPLVPGAFLALHVGFGGPVSRVLPGLPGLGCLPWLLWDVCHWGSRLREAGASPVLWDRAFGTVWGCDLGAHLRLPIVPKGVVAGESRRSERRKMQVRLRMLAPRALGAGYRSVLRDRPRGAVRGADRGSLPRPRSYSAEMSRASPNGPKAARWRSGCVRGLSGLSERDIAVRGSRSVGTSVVRGRGPAHGASRSPVVASGVGPEGLAARRPGLAFSGSIGQSVRSRSFPACSPGGALSPGFVPCLLCPVLVLPIGLYTLRGAPWPAQAPCDLFRRLAVRHPPCQKAPPPRVPVVPLVAG